MKNNNVKKKREIQQTTIVLYMDEPEKCRYMNTKKMTFFGKMFKNIY